VHLFNCFAEACTTGFNLNGSTGNIFVRNLAARGNTTGYVFAGNVYGGGMDGDTNSTLSTGSVINRDLGTVNTVSATSPNRTIQVIINGTTYYIHAKTTND
jgi:hypothetical protein